MGNLLGKIACSFRKKMVSFAHDMKDYKLLPLGISDFRRIRKQNYYYVDKSMYIPKIELASS